jgi:hypothetical protein
MTGQCHPLSLPINPDMAMLSTFGAYDMTSDNAYDMAHDMTLRQNTIASITLEQGTTKRTVQRWIAKCGEIGEIRENTRYFSDEEKAQILSHKTNRKPADEVIECELIEPGAIQLHRSEGSAAAPLVAFNLEPIQIDSPALDVSALTAQTAQFDEAATQGANAIAAALTARFDIGLAQIVAKQDNLLAGIEAQALNGAARSISNQQAKPGKPR